jgi:hypothetical protein
MNFNILAGQHNNQIGALLNHSGQFLESRVRKRCPPPTSLKQLENVQGKWYTIPLDIVQNMHEPILRRNAVVLKEKGGPTPH